MNNKVANNSKIKKIIVDALENKKRRKSNKKSYFISNIYIFFIFDSFKLNLLQFNCL